MTAGPKQRPAKRAKWVDYLAVTYQELTRAFWHRSIVEDLRKEIGTRNPAADGNFVVSYQRLYAESMMMMVRRLADHDKRNVSLWNIWDAIARDPQCVSRAEYVEHFADSRGRESADAYFSSHFGLGDHVDPDVMESYKTTLF